MIRFAAVVAGHNNERMEDIMKIAVSAKGPRLEDEVDPRFGRAAYILIVDTETNHLEIINNSINADAFKGAGIQAASMVHDKGAKVLMTGYCGPKAFQVLEQAGIKVVSDITGTVSQAVTLFKAGSVTYTASANAEAHW